MGLTSYLVIAVQTPAPSATPSVTRLNGHDGGWGLAVIVGFVLLAGIVIAVGRSRLEVSAAPRSARHSRTARGDTTWIRSWLAVSLVGGLLIFTALSFLLDDTTLRSTLIGGVVANAGAAVAFYFASKSSDQARRDILSASVPFTLVPDLAGKDLAKTHEAVAETPFRLEVQPTAPASRAQVVSQYPPANQSAVTGSTVVATFAGPVPNLAGKTADEAKSLLDPVDLVLDPSPAQPPAGSKVTQQDPQPNQIVPPDRKIKATFV